MNNLAELKTVILDDTSVLYHEWQTQAQYFNGKILEWREYVDLDIFTPYYSNLVNKVIKEINLPFKNIVIQYYDHHNSNKWNLNIAHKDADRLSCVTICLTDIYEPVCFYSDEAMPDIRGSQNLPKPIQISRYSKKHPMLVNVNNVHRVHVIEDKSPRILLQISYDIHFDDIIKNNKSIWEIK